MSLYLPAAHVPPVSVIGPALHPSAVKGHSPVQFVLLACVVGAGAYVVYSRYMAKKKATSNDAAAVNMATVVPAIAGNAALGATPSTIAATSSATPNV